MSYNSRTTASNTKGKEYVVAGFPLAEVERYAGDRYESTVEVSGARGFSAAMRRAAEVLPGLLRLKPAEYSCVE